MAGPDSIKSRLAALNLEEVHAPAPGTRPNYNYAQTAAKKKNPELPPRIFKNGSVDASRDVVDDNSTLPPSYSVVGRAFPSSREEILQKFISYFVAKLTEKSGPQGWTSDLRWSDHLEKRLLTLLEAYAIDLRSDESTILAYFVRAQWTDYPERHIHRVARLIGRYGLIIAEKFLMSLFSASAKTVSRAHGRKETGPDLQMKDEDGEVIIDLELMTEHLVSCHAFDKMALAVRETLWDYGGLQIATVRTLMSLEITLWDDTYMRYRFIIGAEWDPFEFMSSQYGTNFPNIAAVITLTGSVRYAHATTCGEYIKTTWPSSGPVFLDLLEKGILKRRTQQQVEQPTSVEIEQGLPRSCQHFGLRLTSGTIEITARGTLDLLTELAQQLCWIGSALNEPAHGGQLCYTDFALQEPPHLEFQLELNTTFTHEELRVTETSCWLPLFWGASIARGFPIPNRGDEVGLEISLQLLAAISGACHAVEFEGGVVMKGFSFMFVPVRKDGDRVQWHAIASLDPETRLTYRDALSRCVSRLSLDELSLDDLAHCRAFVGWCSPAISRLGSSLTNFQNIDYSGVRDADAALRCAGGSLGFQQFGVATLDFKLGAKDGKCHFQRNGPYQRIIYAAERTPVLLYDTREQRAWLVPASDVMLHIAQNRHWLDPFTIQGTKTMPDTTTLPGASAKDILLKCASVQLSDADEYKFKDLIVNIWSLLEYLLDQNVARDRNASGTPIKGPLSEYLYGFEYKAVVEERSPYRLKQTLLSTTHGGWPQLVGDIDALVLLADGFEDIIVPVDEPPPCRRWERMPKGRDYLATSTTMLKDLYDVAGCRLNRKYLTNTHLRWHQGDSLLFDACEGGKDCRCNRLQQIVPKSAVGTVRSPDRLVDNGAAIFGNSGHLLGNLKSKRRSETPTNSGLYSQPNLPLEPVLIRTQAEESSCFEIDSFGESSDTTTNSTPGSNMSCATVPTQDMPTNKAEFSRTTELSPCGEPRQSLRETFGV